MVNQTTALLVWSPPTQPNGIIVGYRVVYGVRATEQIFTVVVDSLDSEQRDYYATNLDAYKYYTFSVAARTQLGWGEPLELDVYTVATRSKLYY